MISINDIDKPFIDKLFEKTDNIIKRGGSKGKCRLNIHSDKILVIDEITTEIDDESNSVYFKQMEYGVKIRMALLDLLLSR